jgi:signal-transduction protein with cAMP-binding, CBS, and nucleotidyltransferase domain
MAQLISAKGSDVMTWRAAGEFTASYRQVIIDRMEFCRSEESGDLLNNVNRTLAELSGANDAFCSSCEGLIEEASACSEPLKLKELTTSFYAGLYTHFGVHRSAPAFYQFSALFLQSLARSVSRWAYNSLGISAGQIPDLALVGLGAAGRQEFSPFCPLQLMLVHGHTVDAEADADSVARFSELVHEGFEACGLRLDEVVTPRNRQWRGSLPVWEQLLKDPLKRGSTSQDIFEILGLTDQTFLDGSAETGNSFSRMALAAISANPVAMKNLVSRVAVLSNGIGIMGGLRFEKSGPYRGQFALLENALQPLAASVSVMSLLKHLETTATPGRIRELLWRRDLNVDMSERLLQAWYALHELRLQREHEVCPDWSNAAPLYLDIDGLNVDGQDSLRESLEAVGTMQRHIGLNFSSIVE